MNAKQKKFCDEYLIDCNATQAAIRAGYSERTAEKASDWINAGSQKKPSSKFNPEMRQYIDEQLEKMHNEKTANAQEVIEYLTSVMRGEQNEETLKLVGDGVQEVTNIRVSARDRLKAAELIGKRYGLFKENIEVGGNVPVVISGGDKLEE